MRSVLVLCLVVAGAQASAKGRGADEERTEIARQHFQAAEKLFAAERYEEAIVEYELAQVAVPLASIDLQIARAYDRLGSPRLAAEGYRRYLAGDPHAADGPEVRLRIAQLEQQQPRAPAPVAAPAIVAPVEPAPVRRAPRYLAPLLVLDLAVPLLIVGGALVGTVDADVDNLRRTCAPRCAPSQLSGLETREQAGYALIGIGAAAAVADAILWFVAYRKRPAAARARLAPSLHGAGAAALVRF